MKTLKIRAIGYWGNYSIFHVCSCGKEYSHSQGDCDEHRLHPLPHLTYPIEYYYRYMQIKNTKDRR